MKKWKKQKGISNEEQLRALTEIYNKGYSKGRQDEYRELSSKYLILSDEDLKDLNTEAVKNFLHELMSLLAKDHMYTQSDIIEIVAWVLDKK